MVLAGLFLVGGGILVWRLNEGPIEVGFARKYIESELSDPASDLALQVGSVHLAWSAIESRPMITLQDVRLMNTRLNRPAFSFQSASVSLSRRGLLLGQVSPRTITLNQPLIGLVRGSDNKLQLSMMRDAAQSTANVAEQPEKTTGDFFEVLDMLAKPPRELPRSFPLRSLRMITITDARMMVEDHVLNQSWLVPKIEMAFRRGEKNLVTSASLWLESDLVKTPTLVAEAAYFGSSRNIVMDMKLHDLRASFLASKLPDLSWIKNQNVSLNGTAQARFDPGMILTQMDATLSSKNGQFSLPDLYDAPLSYQSLSVSTHYDNATKTFTITDSDLRIAEDFQVAITGSVTQNEKGDLHAPLSLRIDSLSQKRVAEYWPKVLRGESAEDWALHRLSEGRLHDSTINATLDGVKRMIEVPDSIGEMTEDWVVDLDALTIDFAVENMTVDYAKPLLPVIGANGRGHYDYATDDMTIDIESGTLGDLDIKAGKIFIDTVYGDDVGTAVIDATLEGPLKTVFDYIAKKPINVTDIPTDVTKVEGTVKFDLKVTLPTLADLPADQIVVAAEGTVENALLPALVNGLDVRGKVVKAKIKDGLLNVSGAGQLDGRDMDFTYDQYFESKGKPYSAQVVADIAVDKGLRDKFGIDLSDWLDGTMPAKITYTQPGGGSKKAEITATIDATPGIIMVKPMNYQKPPGQAGKASLNATLDDGDLKTIQNLTIETPELKATGGQMTFAQVGKETQLRSGKFTRAQLRETDVAIDFILSPANLLVMDIKGGFLDGRPFLENNKNKGGTIQADYTGPALQVTVNANRVRTAEARMIQNVKLNVDMDKKGDLRRIEMDSSVGKGKLFFRYKPNQQGTKMTLRVETDDAGATLQAFDVYENIRGGKMLIAGESVAGGDLKLIKGKGEITNFIVFDAPVLARLVNALSLPGIMQLLNSDGISFTRLESDFGWEMTKGGNVFSFENGRTAGASMGLTFEGGVNGITDTMQINGTIVPVSAVNDLIGNIPLLGDILSGGSAGGVFAATYSVRGPTKTPTTMVNPLAVLTPGFLRRIFFE